MLRVAPTAIRVIIAMMKRLPFSPTGGSSVPSETSVPSTSPTKVGLRIRYRVGAPLVGQPSTAPVEQEEPVDQRKILRAPRNASGSGSLGTLEEFVLFRNRGELHENAGRYQDALTFYNQAICTKSDDISKRSLSHVYLARARVYQHLGHASKSRADCLKAAELGSGLADKPAAPTKAGKQANGNAAAKQAPLGGEVGFEDVANLQVHLQPLLAGIVAFREWLGSGQAAPQFSSEFAPILQKLSDAELQALASLGKVQKDLLKTAPAEEEIKARTK